MGAPIGNNNSCKENRLWGENIRRIAVQNPNELREIAEKLYEMAKNGDLGAIKELGDRIDGKSPTPPAEINVNGKMAIERIERVITDPSNRNPQGIPSAIKS